MTANHLLIYRLAELMLEKQQHVLAVDDLFEDEQIGEFVKSIQIDSPYQQMLLEGVLTESVKENKLYVTFTVEGYFHYVLGEVIYNQATGRAPEFLKNIIENNELSGSNEGVEQCLIRDVENDDLSRLMWLIDQGGNVIDVCSVPLAHAFLQLKGNPKTDEEIDKSSKEQIKRVMNELLADPTDNDIVILYKALSFLENNNKKFEISILYIIAHELVKPKTKHGVFIALESIRHVTPEIQSTKLDNLVNSIRRNNFDNDWTICFRIGRLYSDISCYEKAKSFYEKSIDLYSKKYTEPNALLGFIYNNLGALYHELGEYEKGLDFTLKALKTNKEYDILDFAGQAKLNSNIASIYTAMKEYDKSEEFNNRALSLRIKKFGYQHPATALSYNNLGYLRNQQGDTVKAAHYYQKALNIRMRIFGKTHADVAQSFNNLAAIMTKTREYKKALFYLNESLSIYRKTQKPIDTKIATVHNNIGTVYSHLGISSLARQQHLKAVRIFKELYGADHPNTLFVLRKIEDLNSP